MMRELLQVFGIKAPPPRHVKAFNEATVKLAKKIERRDAVGDVIEGLRSTSFRGVKKAGKRNARHS